MDILEYVCLIAQLRLMTCMLAKMDLYVSQQKIVHRVHMVTQFCINVFNFVQFNQEILQMLIQKNV